MNEEQLLDAGTIAPTGDSQPQEGGQMTYEELQHMYETERKKKYEFMNKYHTLKESQQYVQQPEPQYQDYGQQQDEDPRAIARQEALRVQQEFAHQERERKEWKNAIKANPAILDFEDEIRQYRQLNPNMSIATAYKIANPGQHIQAPTQTPTPSISTKPTSSSVTNVDYSKMSSEEIKQHALGNM